MARGGWRLLLGACAVAAWAAAWALASGPRGDAPSLLTLLPRVLGAALAHALGSPFPTENERAPLDAEHLRAEYDFVVVGAGTAGAAVAARLAEVSNWTVLLVEAGGDENLVSDVPLMASYMANSALDWDLRTEPDPGFCRALEGGQCRWRSGRVLGGTTVINYMVYSRGARADFDAWAALGCEGWAFSDVLPFFLKAEGARPPDLAAQPFHGTKGPVTVEYGWRSPLGDAFLQAAREAGHALRDPHGPRQHGFSRVQATLRRGARCSASKAYLRPLRGAPNLHVAKHTRALRVVLEGRRAVGVAFARAKGRRAASERTVRVRREVVLSAGTMGSPKLLMLSGIGPREHLQDMGIPVVQDLPGVGENLQDHVALGGLSFSVEAVGSTVVEGRMVRNVSMVLDYALRGRGALTLPGGAEVLGFLGGERRPRELLAAGDGIDEDTENSVEDGEEAEDGPAEVELVMGPGALSGDTAGSLRRALGLREDYAQQLLRELRGHDAFAVVPIVLRPRSRGRLRLRSADPRAPPLLYPNYLSHPEDARAIARGAREAIRLSETPALQRLGARLNPVAYPGCENHTATWPPMEDAYWECAVRHFTISMQHQVGTCRMGGAGDAGAVLDPLLRVRGVEGLRVADASVIPVIPSGHTMAPAYMIGERAAHFIKRAHGAA